MRSSTARIVGALALCSIALVAGPSPAAATNFSVTTTSDTIAADGMTSLREAMMSASTNGLDDVISLVSGETYVLTDCGAGALEYSDVADLVVEGNGSTIQQTCPGESIILKTGPNDNVLTLVELELEVGPNGGGNVFGHAVDATSQLVLDQVTIDGGDAGFSGTMIDIDFGPAEFDLVLRDSSITNNTGSGTGNGNPVGVLIDGSSVSSNSGSGVGVSDGSPIRVVDSTIDDNGGVGIVTSGQGFGLQPDVTIINSSVSSNDSGGIFCLSSCHSLLVEGSQIDDNGAAPSPGRGGGITIPIVLQGGDLPTVTITDSSVSGNSADHPGGGILVYASFDSSGPEQPPIEISNSVITGNQSTCAACDGGGLAVLVGNLTIADSTIASNSAGGNGGGLSFERSAIATIVESATVVVTDSVVDLNTAGGDGGGLWLQSDNASVTSSSITATSATGSGGGVSAGGVFNADLVASGWLEVTGSTVSGNDAARGGGLSIAAPDGSRASVVQSTVDSNFAAVSGGGFFVGPTELLDLDYVTITRNESPAGANIASNGPTTIDHSVIAEPFGGSNCGAVVPVAPVLVVPNLLSEGTNWFDDASCQPVGADVVDLGASPELGELADNGGTTLTRLPSESSPIAGLIAVADCSSTEDQRGVSRPAGFGCEPGAVEIANAIPDPPAGFPASRTPNGDLRINGTNASESFVIDGFPDYVTVAYDSDVNDPFNAIIVAPIAGPFRDLRADLRGGNDRIDVNGVSVTRDIRIDGDAGNDVIALYDSETGRDLTIDGGSGEDEVSLVLTEVDRLLRISTGSQDDEVEIFDSSAARLSINTGTGSDFLQYSGGVITGTTTISLGSGDDAGILAELTLWGATTVQAGSGDDTFTVFVSSFNDQFRFLGQGGSDQLSLFDATMQAQAFLNGGGGTDSFTADPGTTFAVAPVVISFE